MSVLNFKVSLFFDALITELGRLKVYFFPTADLVILSAGGEILSCHGYTYYNRQSRHLTSIPMDIPANVMTVVLGDNRITNVSQGAFSHLYQCDQIDLNKSHISVIEPGAFTGLHLLEKLKLGNNYIMSIDSAMWTGLEYLDYLSLTNNYIGIISPEAFSDLIWLKELYLSGNYLTEIHSNMWVGLQFLEELDLSENYIKDIQRHGISHLPSLQTLWLSDNKLRTLRSDMFSPALEKYPQKLNLYLDENDLNCDASICWLKAAVESGSVNILDSICTDQNYYPIISFENDFCEIKHHVLHAA